MIDAPSSSAFMVVPPAGTTAASSNATGVCADIVRLIAPSDRPGFDLMLKHALRGRALPDDELRRLAVTTWKQFCRYGWPRHSP